MKLSTCFLSLLAVSTTFARSLENKFVIRAEQQETTFLDLFTEECKNAIKENNDYYTCVFFDFNLENRKEVCSTFFSDKCQQIFKDIVAPVPACKNDLVFMEQLGQPIIAENSNSKMKYLCTDDGAGHICPGVEALIKGDSITNKNINQNCASKKCLDGTIDYIKFKIDNNEKLCQANIIKGNCQEFTTVMSHLLDIVDNDVCRAEAKDDTNVADVTTNSGNTTNNNNVSSGVNSNKVNFTLLAVALVLSLL